MASDRSRSRQRVLLWSVVLLLPVLLLAALWFGPRLTDWNEHRDRLAILAAGRLGQPVTLAGPVKLTLLPQPMLEAGGVTIGGPDAAISVQARALRLRLDWPALLRLRLEPREVAVVGAEIRLPWPPTSGQPFRPPPWLTGLEGRIQDSRVELGAVELERVDATLAAGGPSDALSIQGRFRWRQADTDFRTTLGRPGWDGIAPLDLTLSAGKASVSASGVLLPEGGFEGNVQGGGSDLAAILPAPPGPFRLRGRLSVAADLLTADELALEIGGSPVRGAATLRVAPVARLDLALSAGRLDLDSWASALRSAAPLPVPFGLDLSAEAAEFRGVTLRRLRGAALLESGQLTLSDFSALLPGDTAIEATGQARRAAAPAAGAASAARPLGTDAARGGMPPGLLEARIHFRGANLRATLAALGLPLQGVDPARLRSGEGTARLTLEGQQIGMPEFAATVDGTRISGAGTWRLGNRPSLGLGLNVERLPLDGWLPAGAGWPEIQSRLAGIDANLRLSAERASWHEMDVEGLSADLSLESGRLTARRLAGHVAGADLALSGVAQLGDAPRLSELALEASAAQGAPLIRLLSGAATLPSLADGRLALRLSGNGPPTALSLQGSLDLGDLRLEAAGTADLPASRYAGAVTMRHPGAPRLLEESLGVRAPLWLGEGSFSVTGNVALQRAGRRQEWQASHFDLIAAGLRLGGQLGLVIGEGRPRLTGRLNAETVPLPGFDPGAREPLELAGLDAADLDLAVTAQRLEPAGMPAMVAASGVLRLSGGVLQLDGFNARLGGGAVEGTLRLEAGAAPPRLTIQGKVSALPISAGLAGLPLDLRAGQVTASGRFDAAGHSPAALLATLEGQAELSLRDGVMQGADLRAAYAAQQASTLPEAEAALRRALSGGATAFEALDASVVLKAGQAMLDSARMAITETPGAGISGQVDLARAGLDLLLHLQEGEAPEIGLRLAGSVRAPRLVPELADWLRWRAAR